MIIALGGSIMRSVPRSDVPESPFVWTRGVASREALRYLDRNGISAEPLLAKAGLSRGQLLRGEGGVSVASQYRFLELAANEADDQLLGLHVGAEMDLRSIGLLFYLSGSSRTVAKASSACKYLWTLAWMRGEADSTPKNNFQHPDAFILGSRPPRQSPDAPLVSTVIFAG